MMDKPSPGTPRSEASPGPEILQRLSAEMARLRFGAIQLTIHEGRLVQMDVTEKHRFSH